MRKNIILQFKFTNVDNPLNVEAAETTITIFFSRAKYKKTNKIDPISNLLSLSEMKIATSNGKQACFASKLIVVARTILVVL